MRTAYGMIGAGILVILGGVYFIDHPFTPKADTSRQTITSSTFPTMSTLTLTSPEFIAGGSIPSKYTCEGERVNPPLSIGGVPTDAKSLVLTVHDPDVPKALKPDGNFDHWVLFNIPADTHLLESGVTVGVTGVNSAGKTGYAAPCPPKEYEPSEHRYFFKLYALDTDLPLQAGASKADVERAMTGHVIAETQLIGTYKKK